MIAFARGGVIATGSLAGKVSFSASSRRASTHCSSSPPSAVSAAFDGAARRFVIIRVTMLREYTEQENLSDF
ncbi:MAG TPA: hypothetical protein VHU18_10380 [Rhizomicrobium sp.]|nr:hypothetical protein [Rhizomicrobium sp.]